MSKYHIQIEKDVSSYIKVKTKIIIQTFFSKKEFVFYAPIRSEVKSPSGRYLLVYFEVFPSDDSDRLVLFDLRNKNIKFSLPEFHYSYQETFSFDNDESLIICHTKICDLYINENGEVINSFDYYERSIELGFHLNKYVIDKYIKVRGDNIDSRDRIIHAIDLSIENEIGNNKKLVSEFLMWKGDFLEQNGDYLSAMQCYRDSIYLNGKSPVKMRIKKLQKFLQ
ncbi:hypothetical protein MKU92_000008 [Salmonella enterica]|nr:hypothetical protein [Salmonella enterica]